MQRTMLLTLLLTLALAPAGARFAAAQAPHARTEAADAIWSGSAGSFRWRWTTWDLAAASLSAGRSAFSATAFEKRVATSLFGPTAKDDDPYPGYVECSIQPLSIVGSVASYERDYYTEGGAHPSGSIDFVSVDAASPAHRLVLTDLFPDETVLKALLADRVIRNTLRRAHVQGTPRNTRQLTALLKGKSFGGEDNGQFGFEEDILARFAFHHLEGERVAVRLNVSWNYEVYRFTSTQIGLLLPIPARLRSAFALAASGKEGFLMADARRRFGDRRSTLFTLGKAPK